MITSVKNEKIKGLRKLQKRREREASQKFLVEGFHLVEEARESDWVIEELIIQEGTDIPEWCYQYKLFEVSSNVFQHFSQMKTPQGIAAVVRMNEIKEVKGNYMLLIDSIQDPGNLGTMIRTAEAAGYDGIILGNDTVDMFNDKVIRATQGSIFHIPVIKGNLEEKVADLKKKGFQVWATALKNAKNYNEVNGGDKVALIVGNEGAGVKEPLLQLADSIVTIPIYGKAESLNVSIAAGILMYYTKS
ncbi:TrmH family RNA methyltransferase [Virgibacillus halodenitrificans]|uniref:TrmH family RNA methyltransferase n=1 Tax=Virgibacillus halodenitrificans TaxID=1482 RepID=UPI00045C8830|nr:RNA methyltransferase [Virgibacillus halodenitrificans]CDQ36935.1 Putative TrmH family tRNA/rRNA methyltransferase [Virgibacillus halodenitrificans]